MRIFKPVVAASAIVIAMPAIARPAEPTGQDATIIITGEKANRTVQDTPTSVAVTGTDRIAHENLLRVQDIYARTANLSETYGAAGFTIRGIANTGVGAGGDADTATVYVDGTPIPADALYGGPTDLWDVAQVEILRGPQSTIQGLDALAGGVVIATRNPSMDHWSGDARLLWTEHDDRAFAIALGGPILVDQIGVRLSGERRADDGIIRNSTRGGTDDGMRSLNLRAKIAITPTAFPDLEILLSFNRLRRSGGYVSEYSRTDVPDHFDHRRSAGDYPTLGVVHSDIAAVSIGYELSPSTRLSSVTSWNRSAGRSRIDSDGGPIDLQHIDEHFRHRTVTQELRLNHHNGPLDGLLGLWYYRRASDNRQDSRISAPTPVTTLDRLLQANGVPAPVSAAITTAYAAALPYAAIDYEGDLDKHIETLAIFGDARLRFTSILSLIAGFRYDHERTRYAAQTSANLGSTLPDPAGFGPVESLPYYAVQALNTGMLGLVSQASSPSSSNDPQFNAFLPKLGISADWTSALSTAFTVQRAYRSGGASQNRARATLVRFGPEYSWNYELSLRSQWLDGALTVNANAFHVDWRDQQVRANFGLNIYDYHSVNVGRSHLNGFELEVQARPVRTIGLYASIGHVRTRFDDFSLPSGATSTVTLSGTQFPYAPRWTLAGGIDAKLAPSLWINFNGNYRSAMFTDVGTAQNQQRVKGRTIFDLALRHEARNWTATLFARNLLDQDYVQYDYAAVNYAVLGDPRTIGLRLDGRF
ncbi:MULTISPECIES: TonB-dependent receptor [unclassified Sphingobium]|uniref:TonB-dependent receptor n=1 Tax=unclassified Sphingobium TaxID=2611147 RepID=UPI0035A636F6